MPQVYEQILIGVAPEDLGKAMLKHCELKPREWECRVQGTALRAFRSEQRIDPDHGQVMVEIPGPAFALTIALGWWMDQRFAPEPPPDYMTVAKGIGDMLLVSIYAPAAQAEELRKRLLAK